MNTNYKKMKLEDIRPAEYNPRSITPDARAGLAANLKRFGLVQNLVVNKRTGNLVGGHQRLAVMLEAGEIEAMVCEVDLSETEEKALNISLNNPNIGGEFTDELQGLLQSIAEDDIELFTDVQLDLLVEEEPLEGSGSGSGETMPEEIQKRVKYGDIWGIGNHRLLCGDCRNLMQVARLFEGGKANICFTSPPYASQRKYDETSPFKPIKPEEYGNWFDSVQAVVRKILQEDGSFFLNIKEHTDKGARVLYVKKLVIEMVEKHSWRFVDELCWVRAGVPGKFPNRFKNGFEPIFHFSDSKKIKTRFNNVRHESSDIPSGNGNVTVSDGGFTDKGKRKNGLAYPSNVLKINTGGCIDIGSVGTKHPAVFPSKLPEFFIEAFTDEGDIIYDPFMGSGSTMYAADEVGRIAYGAEISEEYCDLILARMENKTGEPAFIISCNADKKVEEE